ncbi:Trp biosynthesis-associated membrane protein [Trujillonella humicola]|uniref:Trp biosynthesis-associated membrane protein n=1 Tax=Trujillonella humicola TaxID=3383699 RepID=UPI003906569D
MTRARRELTAAVAGCGIAGGLALSAGGQAWATATVVRRAPLPPVTEELAGTELAALVPACGLLLLAAAVAVVAVRGRARQVVGLLAAAGGATLLWSGVQGLATTPGAGDLPDGVAAGATAVEVSRSVAWPVLTALAGALAVAAGVLALVRGRTWSGMGRRYERATVAAPAAAGTREDRALDAWRALDRGEDPTADDDPPPAGPPPGGAPAGGAPAGGAPGEDPGPPPAGTVRRRL